MPLGKKFREKIQFFSGDVLHEIILHPEAVSYTHLVSELHAGDIGALAKLTAARTGNSLSTKATTIKYGKFDISTPYTYMRYKPKNKADVDKISQALQKMTHEDLTIKVVNDAENRQTLLYGMGDQHLDIVVSRLLNEYKVEIELSRPKIAYKETIKKQSDVEYK